MACDIHGWIEMRKYPNQRCWSPVMPLMAGLRDYDIFSRLFGVRSAYPDNAIAPRRGLPEDVSEEVQDDAKEWRVDAHSHSWVGWNEIRHQPWLRPRYHWEWPFIFNVMELLSKHVADIRLVVWFDN